MSTKKNEHKREFKKIDTESFLMSNLLYFTDDEEDLISNDFHLEKEQIKKKKEPRKKSNSICRGSNELEKPKGNEEYDLTNQQKHIIQKNSIIKERLLAVDKILELYPNLKKDKRSIINNVLGKQELQKKTYVIEKINVKNKSIYKDSFGNLIDENVNLVGFWTESVDTDNKEKKIPIYHFFNEIKKIKTKISRNKRKINLTHIVNINNKNKGQIIQI